VLPFFVWLVVGALGSTPICAVLPVESEPIDFFRPPACPWCPGNRGWEWSLDGPTPVRTPLAGRVTFAGSVAGDRYVTVRIGEGRRTTVGPLLRIEPGVAVGETVAGGHVVGVADARLMLTFRDGEQYLDPYVLWRVRRPSRLVPLQGAAPRSTSASACPVPRWGRPSATG
jgi:hypothetical protein